MGDAAPNDEKDAEEGQWETTKRVWGLDVDTRARSITLPPAELEKMSHVLHDPGLDPGAEFVEVEMLQILRGNMQYWLVVNPSLRAEVGAIGRALAFVKPAIPYLVLKGDPEEAAAVLTELWDTVELARLMAEVPELWTSHFTSSFPTVLPPRERLGMPGEAERVVWLGSDATPTRVGAIDWTHSTFFEGDVEAFWPRLVDIVGRHEPKELIVSAAELLSVVVMSAASSAAWAGRLVLYLGDNMNVVAWLGGTNPKNPFARHLLRCLTHLQTRDSWQMLPGYIRTYHNDANDLLTRGSRAEVEGLAESYGLRRLDGKAAWEEAMVLGYSHRALAWKALGGEWETALQLRELRLHREVPLPLRLHNAAANYTLIEWRAGLAGYAKAWTSLGGKAWATPAPIWGANAELGFKTLGIQADGAPRKCDVVAATLTEDREGKEMVRLAEYAWNRGAKVIVADYPRGAEVRVGLRFLFREGYTISLHDEVCTAYGDPTTKRRRFLAAVKTQDDEEELVWRWPSAKAKAPGVTPWLLKADEVRTEAWEAVGNWEYTADPRMKTTGNPLLPRAAGYVQSPTDHNKRMLVYNPAGPVPTIRGEQPDPLGWGVWLLRQEGGPGHGVRTLRPEEVWAIQGGGAAELLGKLMTAKLPPKTVEAVIVRATPPETLTAMMGSAARWVDAWIRSGKLNKVGVCYHPEETELTRRLMGWLRAWIACPEEPAAALDKTFKKNLPKDTLRVMTDPSNLQDRVAGPRHRRDYLSPWLDAHAQRLTAHGPDTYLANVDLGEEAPAVQGMDLEEERRQLVMRSWAEGTHRVYDGAWKRWIIFCETRGQAKFLVGQTTAEHREEEDQVLDYIVHLSKTMLRAAKTVENATFAVRARHLQQGFNNPLDHMPRVRLAIKGLKRVKGATSRKWPVTAAMLRRAANTLDPGKADGAVLLAALETAWNFLLRASEYVRHPGKAPDRNKVLRGCDVSLQRAGVPCGLGEEPDEIVLRILGTKVDQLNVGQVRNHYATGDGTWLCPVRVLANLRKHFPDRFADGPEGLRPLFRYSNGEVVSRKDVTDLIERAAIQEGVPAENVGSHSLRIGGACALYHVYGSVDMVRRFGRWASSSFHVYPWEARTSDKGIAADMSKSTAPLMAAHGLGADPTKKGVRFAV